MSKSLVTQEELMRSQIYLIERDGSTIPIVLDKDLTKYFEIETSALNRAAKRNKTRFHNRSFKLTKEEYEIILKQRNELPLDGIIRGIIPTAYTEEGALALSSVLNSTKAEEVFSLLLKSFFAVKQIVQSRPDLLLHQEVYDLKNRVISLEAKISSTAPIQIGTLQNHGGQIQFGNQNSMNVQITGFTDIIRLMSELLDHPQVKASPQFTQEIKEAISLALKEDKKGLLEKTKTISEITNNIADLAIKASPILLPILSWLANSIW